MIRGAVFALFLAAATAAAAQDVLTPTDVLEGGEFSATISGRYSVGKGTIKDPGFELDADFLALSAALEGGIGLGRGFEVEFVVPGQPWSETTGDGTFGALDVELEDSDVGFGDAELHINYRLMKMSATSPQVLLGVIVVGPTGNDKRGEAEVKIGGVTVQEHEEGGIGQGVWKVGVAGGIGMMFTEGVEGYFAATWVDGGSRERNDIDEERADIATFLAGVEFRVTPDARVDLRGTLAMHGEDVTEDNLAENTEEEHLQYGGQALLYINMGPGFTLTAGGGITFIEDHLTDEVAGTEIQDGMVWFVQIGLHIMVGGTPPAGPRRR